MEVSSRLDRFTCRSCNRGIKFHVDVVMEVSSSCFHVKIVGSLYIENLNQVSITEICNGPIKCT